MFVNARLRDRLGCHGGNHVRRLDATAFDFFHVEGVHAIDERAVPFVIGIEVRAETTIDKDIDDVAEADEEFEMEAFDEKRQDILRTDAFESFFRAIPVLILRLDSLELPIEFVGIGQFPPEFVYEF